MSGPMRPFSARLADSRELRRASRRGRGSGSREGEHRPKRQGKSWFLARPGANALENGGFSPFFELFAIFFGFFFFKVQLAHEGCVYSISTHMRTKCAQ